MRSGGIEGDAENNQNDFIANSVKTTLSAHLFMNIAPWAILYECRPLPDVLIEKI